MLPSVVTNELVDGVLHLTAIDHSGRPCIIAPECHQYTRPVHGQSPREKYVVEHRKDHKDRDGMSVVLPSLRNYLARKRRQLLMTPEPQGRRCPISFPMAAG